MKLAISAPSKTFLLGEYAALVGCPALVLNTEPRFELQIEQTHHFNVQGIETQSPAGRFIKDNQAIFKSYRLNFIDPHQKQGGFGASSAQFLMVYCFYQTLQQFGKNLAEGVKPLLQLTNSQLPEFRSTLLATYLNYAWNGIGIAPSGADIMGQLYGHITWFDKSNNEAKILEWPFPNLQLLLLRTGVKIATHEHLKQLTNISYEPFSTILAEAYQSLSLANEVNFLQAINNYANILATYQFVATTTQELLANLNQLPYVSAAKGCGALGADVILCLVKQQNLINFQHWLNQQNIHYFTANTSPGLQIS
ncbi:MAG: hypothetical protein K0S11_494 [Gammaproteobacteria bacterium]|jgi:mevalonate kinase|nr:hypothetical protein [Gammaproteobacteria bacterium]